MVLHFSSSYSQLKEQWFEIKAKTTFASEGNFSVSGCMPFP